MTFPEIHSSTLSGQAGGATRTQCDQPHARARDRLVPGSGVQSLSRRGYRLNSGLPTGTTVLPFMPLMTPAAEAYQATSAVMTPM